MISSVKTIKHGNLIKSEECGYRTSLDRGSEPFP